ncbi:hypothetical protein DE146DRAFT_783390 [Phaeosphaeria sp. MPI-PUGE-AT-0046c]|nr:hypothetical protein DE146DRAFT_783390 [Phaeosphaeria sp. MPI-PUGE-AT-0046c]
MSNNENNSRRNGERHEDNPFIAFRRFADSQVSSLLNTVFTLPATIANHNNAHKAREACLFKKADRTQCDQLQQIEDELAMLRQEGRELYRVGDLQEVLKKSEELMKLDRHADELRRGIVEQTGESEMNEDSKELVHRIANRKGQEWGWDWSWGFPKPFDDQDLSQSTTGVHTYVERYRDENIEAFRRLEKDAKRIFGEEAWNDAMGSAMDAVGSNPLFRSLVGEEEWKEIQRIMYGGDSEIRRQHQVDAEQQRREVRSRAMNSYRSRAHSGQEDSAYSPEALESDGWLQNAGVNWREAYNDLVRVSKQADSKELYSARAAQDWTSDDTGDEPSYEYSHDHEDQHDDPPTPKSKQFNSSTRSWGWCAPAQTEDASDRRDLQEFLHQQQQNGRQLDIHTEHPVVETCNEAKDQSNADKIDIQKFLREQQEHNGLQLGLRDQSTPAETELDAYEQLLEKPKTSPPSSSVLPAISKDDANSSILSTLTTTERSVAPDGSVTTKVVLKKRFSDGREESSETVHTRRGHEMHPWHSDEGRTVPQSEKKLEQQEKEKKRSGWFWSS